MLRRNPDDSTSSIIAYFNPTTAIDMIAVSFDESTGLSKKVSIAYNKTVNASAVAEELDKTYMPYVGLTTDTYKAYMDSDKREHAALAVAWDIPGLTLTFVNLAN